MKPFDITLNGAVIAISRELFPDGFDISWDAPETLQQIRDHLDAGKRMVVYAEGSDESIYGDAQVNYAFRAWHDWCHYITNNDFTVKGELGVYNYQMAMLAARFGKVGYWSRLLYADVVGQRLYYLLHHRYVDDQRGFVATYLNAPYQALGFPWW